MLKRTNGYGHNSGSLWLRRSYNFVDKNPECDRFRTIYQKERIKEDDLAALAGLSTSTVKNLFGGKTRDPRQSTFAKLAGAFGYKYDLVRDEPPDYKAEIPKAKEQRLQYRALLMKKRERTQKRA